MSTKFIVVSIDIMHDTNLNLTQKFLLAEIQQLNTFEAGCHASNQHFATLIGVDKLTISRSISSLQKMGYIQTDIVKGTRNHLRYITPHDKISTPLDKSSTPPIQIVNPPLTNRQEAKENKTTNKTTNTNSLRSNKKVSQKNLLSFKSDYLSNYKYGQTFTTNDIGFLADTKFTIQNNLIVNTLTNKPVQTSDAVLIWHQLFVNHVYSNKQHSTNTKPYPKASNA